MTGKEPAGMDQRRKSRKTFVAPDGLGPTLSVKVRTAPVWMRMPAEAKAEHRDLHALLEESVQSSVAERELFIARKKMHLEHWRKKNAQALQGQREDIIAKENERLGRD